MKYAAKLLSPDALLAIGGICMFAGALFIYAGITVYGAKVPVLSDPFLLGQYYFNADNDQSGPYDLKKARTYYMIALKQDPKGNPLSWYQLGRIDFLEGRYISALYKFDKQIKYFGAEVPNVYYMIGLTNGFMAGVSGSSVDWERAAAGFTEYLKYDPTSPWAHVDLAWIYFSEGKYSEMIPVLEEGLLFDPHHPWLLNMYGLALLNTGKQEDALLVFERAQEEASKLTVSEWGKAYPGNNPDTWSAGLMSFEQAIEKNIELAKQGIEY